MKTRHHILMAAFVSLISATVVTAEPARTVDETYPGLATGALTYAAVADLPVGVLLKAEGMEVVAEDLNAAANRLPEWAQREFQRSPFVLLEQIIAPKELLLKAARQDVAQGKLKGGATSDKDLLDAYFDSLIEGVKVSDEDVKAFYEKNKGMFCNARFDQVEDDIERFLFEQKKQDTVTEHIRTIGQRIAIEVSASWLKEQDSITRDNPIDKARLSGKPTLVNFGGKSCCGPDTMLPVIEAVREKIGEQVNIVYMEAKDRPDLTARFRIISIPSQILFNDKGRQVFHHTGGMSQEEIEIKLAEVNK
ncbi:MAG TPA: thioredoxin family protein [Candidatus Brocadiia bacterium]|nr:thioredoxin family protein [Candidatus Brocadiia bacterium]